MPRAGRFHCVSTEALKSLHISIWHSRPGHASKLQRSFARLWKLALKTTERLGCARTTTQTTMLLSSSVPTGTTSKRFATSPRPNPSLEPDGERLVAYLERRTPWDS